jgi:hypothetical protein
MYIMKFEKILQNKYVLYFLVFLATTQVIGYLMVKDDRSVALFLVFSLFASLFTKNMIIILAAGILGTNLYKVIMVSRSQESMAGRRGVEELKVEIEDDGEGGEISLEIPSKEEEEEDEEEVDDMEVAEFEEEFTNSESSLGSKSTQKEVDKALKDLAFNLNSIGMNTITDDPELKKKQKNLKDRVKKLEPFLNKISDSFSSITGAYDFKEGYSSSGGARKKRK